MIRLGAMYNCFEGSELLRYSIRQIRPHVDFILLMYQKFSWYGHPVLGKDLNEIESLLKEKLVDQIFCFYPEVFAIESTSARTIEAQKRNVGRSLLYSFGMTHMVDLDTDEFYKKDEFEYAKAQIELKKLEYSAVNYINYYKCPTFQVVSSSAQRVPFICKIDPNKTMGETPGNFVINKKSMSVDLTRGYDIFNNQTNSYLFNSNEITMHHMLSVRKNMKYKWKVHSGTAPLGKTKEQIADEMLSLNSSSKSFDAKALYRGQEQIKIVDNYFGIPDWSNQC